MTGSQDASPPPREPRTAPPAPPARADAPPPPDVPARDGGRGSYRELLGEPSFRVLFVTRSLVIAADTLRMVALSVLVYGRTGSPLLAAVAFAIGFLPQVAGGALLGSLADRMRPRPLMSGVYALSAAVAAVLALLDPPVAVSLALVAAVACVTPVVSGAVNRLVAEVLPGEGYVLGRSLMMIASSAAQLLGLAFGGVAVAALGPRYALLATCAAYALAAVLVRVLLEDMPPAAPEDGGAGPGSSFLQASRAVNRRLLGDREVRVMLLAQWLPVAFVAGAESLLIPYARVRGYPDGTEAVLLACVPAGMMAGNLVAGRLLAPATRERLVVPMMVVFGAPLVPLAAVLPVTVVAVLLAVTGAGFAYELGIQRRFVEAVPEGARGQAFGLLSTGVMTLQGVGPVVFGGLAEVAGVGWSVAAAGAATMLTAVWLRGGLGSAAKSRPTARA
ncbi:MFS transporter [Actinomadura viridis]|uniref:MFS family arabinose efflux permease n=1 Tax=Actinomadura viridis TaxID=58110 RepID=A0A931DIK2_9ACTN|nr:MFS transporter [Actinomadura viridis]MBG6090022.1 putative MFS family arabinose efflux permease [Actinomadura viridis]